MWQINWTNDGEKRSWVFTRRERAIYWLNVLILDLGFVDARLTRVRRIRH